MTRIPVRAIHGVSCGRRDFPGVRSRSRVFVDHSWAARDIACVPNVLGHMCPPRASLPHTAWGSLTAWW
eukprot:3180085-Heterocapsa_arctica.AAC.1